MFFTKLDVEVFSFIVLMLAYANSSKYQKNTNKYLPFLRITTLCIIVILIIDMLVLSLENLHYPIFANITAILISLNGIFTPMCSWLWFVFLLYYLTPNNKSNPKKIILSSSVLIFNTFLVVINAFTGIMFSISKDNVYTRNSWFTVFTCCCVFYMVIAMIFVLKHRKNLNNHEFFILLSFEIFPLVGGIIQSQFYGTVLTYPLSTLSLMLIYIYLNRDISVLHYISKAYTTHYFWNFCNKEIVENKKSDYSLAYIDIDNLGVINRTFGHNEGDFLLAKFVEIVNKCIAEPDFISHAGGDEFTIYFDNNNEEQIITNLKIIARNVEYYNKTSNKPYNINFTFSYVVNDDTKAVSPFRLFKTLYYNLALKKEKKILENGYKPVLKEVVKIQKNKRQA